MTESAQVFKGVHDTPVYTDLLFHKRESLPQHPNGMRMTAFDAGGVAHQLRRHE